MSFLCIYFYLCPLLVELSSPDIQRDRHHCVEDDDVGPEGEEGIEQKVVHRRVPGQVALKQGAHLSLPHSVTNGQDHTHTHQEAKDLTETHKWRNTVRVRCLNVQSGISQLDLWSVEPKLG